MMMAKESINSVSKKFIAASVVAFTILFFFWLYTAFYNSDSQTTVFSSTDSTSADIQGKKQLVKLVGLINNQLSRSKVLAKKELPEQLALQLPAIYSYLEQNESISNFNLSQVAKSGEYNLMIYKVGMHEWLQDYLGKLGIKGYLLAKITETLNSFKIKDTGLFEIADADRSVIVAYRYDVIADGLVCLWFDSETQARDIAFSTMRFFEEYNQESGRKSFLIDNKDAFYITKADQLDGSLEQVSIDEKLLKEIRYTSVAYGAGSLKIDSARVNNSVFAKHNRDLILSASYISEADMIVGLIAAENTDSAISDDDFPLAELIIIGMLMIFFCMLYCYFIRKVTDRIYHDLRQVAAIDATSILPVETPVATNFWFKDLLKVANHIYSIIQLKEEIEQKNQSAELKYQNLFQSISIPLWEKDITDLLEENKALLESSSNEFNNKIAHIGSEKWVSYLRMIKNLEANLMTLNLFGFNSQNDLFGEIDPLLSVDNCYILKEIIKAVHAQRGIIRLEKSIVTFNERQVDLLITISFKIRSDRSTILLSMVDISNQKRSARLLEEEKEFILQTLGNVTDGVIAIDRNFMVTLANKTVAEFLSHDSLYLHGKQIMEVLKPLNTPDRLVLDKLIKTVAKKGITIESKETILFRNENGDEHSVVPIVVAVLDKNAQFNGAVITFKDISSQKRLEKELIATKNMEAIGNLSGGFAHEFNNYLQAILGNITLAGIYSIESPKVLTKVDAAKDLCLKAKTVTERLLTFSLLGKPNLAICDTEVFLREAINQLTAESKVSVKINIGKNLSSINIDEMQIKQVIADILAFKLSNSAENTELTITAENYYYNNFGYLQLEPGDFVKVSCLERGVELPAEIIRRIFDPYFTNKEIGVGLALASAYYTLIYHHGWIEAFNTPGVGNTFCFYLPAVKTSLSFIVAEKSEDAKKKILVMDDDEQIRELACEMLSYSGFETYATVEGNETVRLYQEHLLKGDPFDLVILDLHIVNGLNGEETIKQLLQIDPEVKAVVSSGFTNDKVLSDHTAHGFKASVKKPYAFQELLSTINAVLGL